MKEILGLSLEEFQAELQPAGIKPYVARQVFQWVYQKGREGMDRWSNISRDNRAWLSRHFRISSVQLRKTDEDRDGTRKLLIGLKDGQRIESVLIPEKGHFTFCLSTQVGCPLGCRFCATGKMGFFRNLSPEEILAQVFLLKKNLGARPGKINLVFMGMGEPLLNYSSLAKALACITSPDVFCISPRHVTVSTAGILEPLQKLEHDFPMVKIAFSLNAPSQGLRQQLMPHSQKHKLQDILVYFRGKKRKHRVTFEYVLFKGINDAPGQASQLSRLLHGIPAKINLIPYNETSISGLQAPEENTILEFQRILLDKGYTAIVRWSKGRGIRSACGQLATG